MAAFLSPRLMRSGISFIIPLNDASFVLLSYGLDDPRDSISSLNEWTNLDFFNRVVASPEIRDVRFCRAFMKTVSLDKSNGFFGFTPCLTILKIERLFGG